MVYKADCFPASELCLYLGIAGKRILRWSMVKGMVVPYVRAWHSRFNKVEGLAVELLPAGRSQSRAFSLWRRERDALPCDHSMTPAGYCGHCHAGRDHS